jgi:hypothetical protein
MDQSSWGNLLVVAVLLLGAAVAWNSFRSRGRADRKREKRESAAHLARVKEAKGIDANS